MDHNRQIDQISTLSREHILSCAYCLHSEAGVILGAKQRRSKQAIPEAIVNILRQSLLNVQSGSMISKPHCILLRLRLTDNPACLHDQGWPRVQVTTGDSHQGCPRVWVQIRVKSGQITGDSWWFKVKFPLGDSPLEAGMGWGGI